MTRTIRNQATMNLLALGEAHPFQKERLEILLAQGWNVYLTSSHGWVHLIFVIRDGVSQMVKPDGGLQGTVKGTGKFKWDWERMEALKTAPAAEGLVKARQQLAA